MFVHAANEGSLYEIIGSTEMNRGGNELAEWLFSDGSTRLRGLADFRRMAGLHKRDNANSRGGSRYRGRECADRKMP